MLYTDASMSRPGSVALLDGAREGRYRLVVPEVVIAESTKHYGQRLRKALKEINLSIGKQQRELTRLGEPPVPLHEVPSRQDAEATYAERLRERLDHDGVTVAESPPIDDAIAWYVSRRKPFKETGEGLADVVVWLTVLQYAGEAHDVVLLSANVHDFGDGADPAGLAEPLRKDLRSRGIPDDRVRLVTDASTLIEETTDPTAAARRILESPGTRGRLIEQLMETLAYKPVAINQEGGLPFELDESPQIVVADLAELTLNAEPSFYGDALFMSVDARGEFLLHALVFKSDYYGAPASSAISVTDWDWSRHYVAVEVQATGALDVNFVVEPDGSIDDVEINDLEIDPGRVIGRGLRPGRPRLTVKSRPWLAASPTARNACR